MIRPPGMSGAAFTTAADGDMRGGARLSVSEQLSISDAWATVRQVHGSDVIEATTAGVLGDADALVVARSGLPAAVLTADCAGIVFETGDRTAVVHAGWRGVVAGIVSQVGRHLADDDGSLKGAIGPMIGPCCFEVGPEVAEHFVGFTARTTWGTLSVDLPAAIRDQAPAADWWTAAACTKCGDGWFSHRASGTTDRMAAIGWRL